MKELLVSLVSTAVVHEVLWKTTVDVSLEDGRPRECARLGLDLRKAHTSADGVGAPKSFVARLDPILYEAAIGWGKGLPRLGGGGKHKHNRKDDKAQLQRVSHVMAFTLS
jgi:hypothetical protein